MSRGQRLVVVVAWGAALYFVGQYVTGGARPLTGWTGYAPLQAVPVSTRFGLTSFGSLLVWLGLVVLWAVGALLLLRRRVRNGGERSHSSASQEMAE